MIFTTAFVLMMIMIVNIYGALATLQIFSYVLSMHYLIFGSEGQAY